MKKAWLIGINYLDNPKKKLKGCITDINNIYNMLINAYNYNSSNIILLRDDNSDRFILPTRKNIIQQLEIMVNESDKLSEIWFHYSGHGSQIKIKDDKYVETIVPIDYKENGVIYDYEILDYLTRIKCRLLLFFDSCHSGTVCDLPYIIEWNNGELLTKKINDRIIHSNIIMISGCKDDQTSLDSINDLNENTGAFTNALIKCLQDSQHNIDIISLYKNICSHLRKDNYKQIPVLSCSKEQPEYIFFKI